MRSGLLNDLEEDLNTGNCDDAGTCDTVVDGDNVLAEISAGNEDIIPDDYAQANGGMTIVENLSDAIEAEEIVIEEIEQPLLTEGTESDFNKTTLAMLAASNAKLNMLMGVTEVNGAPVAGLQSNNYGGYKATFEAGLEAKQEFLKNLKAKAAAGFKAMLETIRKFIQKALIYFNGAKTSANKISEILKKKTNNAPEGKDLKLTDSDKKDIAKRFAGWIAAGNTVESFVDYAKMLATPVVPEAGQAITVRHAGKELGDNLKKSLNIAGGDKYSLISAIGANVKCLVFKSEAKGKSLVDVIKEIFSSSAISFASLEVASANVNVDDASKKIGDSVFALTILEKFATETATLADQLKSKANENYDAASSYSKAIAGLKEDEKAKGETLDKISRVSTRVALENVSAYMSAMKAMLWLSSTYAKRYADSK